MGPNFAGHPMGHPGVAGHPMAGPGMQPNAGQQGAPGGMPHQFAVSGPGGQVNPALMGGMPPGANPNPHPMHQMSAAQQQQMFQQQQQQLQQQCKYSTDIDIRHGPGRLTRRRPSWDEQPERTGCYPPAANAPTTTATTAAIDGAAVPRHDSRCGQRHAHGHATHISADPSAESGAERCYDGSRKC